jgi:hypothetical protein
MGGRKKSERLSDRPVVRTGTKVFSDGSIVDLIRVSNGELRFLIRTGKSVKTAGQFVRQGEIFAPLQVDPSILHLMRLPSGTAEYGSTRKLFTEISELISRAEVDDVVAKAASFSVFATWMADYLAVPPFLWIVAPPTSSPGPLLQLMQLLCRRPLVVSDISPARFRFLPVGLQPTLLLDIFHESRQVLNLLRASKRHRALIASDGKAVDAFGARIVFSHEPLRDPASAGFPLELVLAPTRKYVPPMSSLEVGRIAAEYQAKLLSYRILNCAKVRTPAFDLSQFTIPMQEAAHSLAASIVDDDELQSQIVPLLKALDREIRVDRTYLLQAIVLEVLLVQCHSVTGKYFSVADLTGDVNTLLCGRGETLEVSPENIGWTLRALGLHTDFIPGGRKGLVLSNDVRKKIHDLAAAYGVRTLRELPAKIDCQLCAALAQPWKLEADAAGSIVNEG